MTIATDSNDLSIPGILEVAPIAGGQIAAIVSTPHCKAKLFLHGATVTEFQPSGEKPLLFTSSKAVFNGVKAIRGGIPICFPWFNAHPDDTSLPNHGLVRTRQWKLTESNYDKTSGTLTLVCTTEVAGFALRYEIQFHRTLSSTLIVTNSTKQTLPFELALHTYLSVSDIKQIEIEGLSHQAYLDNLKNDERFVAPGGPISFREEYDRVFVDTPDDVILNDPAMGRKIRVSKVGANSTVVWNPWIKKAADLSDLHDDEWQRFCCIESGCIANNSIILPPGESHEVGLTISIDRSNGET